MFQVDVKRKLLWEVVAEAEEGGPGGIQSYQVVAKSTKESEKLESTRVAYSRA